MIIVLIQRGQHEITGKKQKREEPFYMPLNHLEILAVNRDKRTQDGDGHCKREQKPPEAIERFIGICGDFRGIACYGIIRLRF